MCSQLGISVYSSFEGAYSIASLLHYILSQTRQFSFRFAVVVVVVVVVVVIVVQRRVELPTCKIGQPVNAYVPTHAHKMALVMVDKQS